MADVKDPLQGRAPRRLAAQVYELMRSGALRSVRLDGLRRVPVAALVEFVARLEADAA
jgi:hypothetical protein